MAIYIILHWLVLLLPGWENIVKGQKNMPKKTPDYDNVFKTMKSKHKRLFISVINDIFGKEYPLDIKVEVLLFSSFQTDRK